MHVFYAMKLFTFKEKQGVCLRWNCGGEMG